MPVAANVERPVAVVLADDEVPHLFTPFLADAAGELGLDDDHLHGPTYLDVDEGVEAFAAALAELLPSTAIGRGRRGDRGDAPRPGALLRRLAAAGGERGDERGPAGQDPRRARLPPPRRCGSPSRRWPRSRPRLVPGARQTDLTAIFLHRVFELGAEANVLDPIWQVMPDHQADLPWTVHGDIACPLLSTERDAGRGRRALGRHRHHLRRLPLRLRPHVGGRAPSRPPASRPSTAGGARSTTPCSSVMRAGVPASDLTAAAMEVCGGERPWMAHFYLGHGLGLDSAEAPYVGTDLGDSYDRRLVLAAGTVLVVEPVVWDEGHSGYRSENVFVVTDDGCVNLSDYPYDPYGD